MPLSREKCPSNPMLEGKSLFGKTVKDCVGRTTSSQKVFFYEGTMPAIQKKSKFQLMFSLANRTLPHRWGSTGRSPGSAPVALCCSVAAGCWRQQTSCGPDPAALPAGPQHSADCQCDKWLLSASLPVTGEGTAKWKLPRRSLPAGSCGPGLRGANEGSVGANAD